ncbi:Uncharacterised protein [Mycobacteroides abscessus subsp. abscessus]|uniref:VG15 protein n=1 Tax=Mycobacteroides abscessus TaxID=36809 RepID=UPI00092C3566|nr:hypothetical protein [Mycobacteroides abscessus]SIL72062.1 Uncharacterised protein [Mycobacteroides abscessus subsp. abscessus]
MATQDQGAAQKRFQPLSDLAAFYAQQHMQDQQNIAAQTAAGLLLLWPILNFRNLDQTTAVWLHATTLEIEKQFRASEDLAFEYVQAAKWSVAPDAPELEKVTTAFPTEQVQLGMRVTGPIAVKQKVGDAPPEGVVADDVMAQARTNTTGVGVKHAMNGGRGEVQQQVEAEYDRAVAAENAADSSGASVVDLTQRRAERKAIGYARMTDDNPCYFCAVLASQGAVYLNANSFDRSNSVVRDIKRDGKVVAHRPFVGDGLVKVHDHCRCQLRPVFREADKMDERANYFLKQWEKFGKGGKGEDGKYRDAMQNFRRSYVPPPPYQGSPAVDIAAVRANREALISAGFDVNSANVRFYDRSLSLLEAV